MAAYKFERLVDDSHVIELPPEVPTGWVEISIIPKLMTPAEVSSPAERFFATLDEIMSRPARNRSNEDIDAQLRQDRKFE